MHLLAWEMLSPFSTQCLTNQQKTNSEKELLVFTLKFALLVSDLRIGLCVHQLKKFIHVTIPQIVKIIILTILKKKKKIRHLHWIAISGHHLMPMFSVSCIKYTRSTSKLEGTSYTKHIHMHHSLGLVLQTFLIVLSDTILKVPNNIIFILTPYRGEIPQHWAPCCHEASSDDHPIFLLSPPLILVMLRCST